MDTSDDKAAPADAPKDGAAATSTPAPAPTPAPQTAPAAPKKIKKTYRNDLTVTSHTAAGMEQKSYQAAFERETYMTNQDRVVAETSLARNALEGYILEMRNKLEVGTRTLTRDFDCWLLNTLLLTGRIEGVHQGSGQ